MQSNSLNHLLNRLKEYTDLPLEEARTLDPEHYLSPELYELEIEHIWKKHWIGVGHVSDLKNPGDYFAYDVVDEPLIFVRGDDGEIRAISSICRHRFMPIVPHGDRGNANRFTCPYHRWMYRTDGNLHNAPHMDSNRLIAGSKIHLPEFRVEIWNGFIFVNLDDDAEPLAPHLTEIEDELAYCGSEEAQQWVNPYPYDGIWSANWKLCVENNENYHTMGVHSKTAQRDTPTRNIQPAVVGDYWTKQSTVYDLSRPETKARVEAAGWTPSEGENAPLLTIYTVSPAISISTTPSSMALAFHLPLSIDSTRNLAHGYSLPEFSDKVDNPEDAHLYQIVVEDKIAFDAGIGRAVRSKKLEPGLLSFMEEAALRQHQWTARQLLEAVG